MFTTLAVRRQIAILTSFELDLAAVACSPWQIPAVVQCTWTSQLDGNGPRVV